MLFEINCNIKNNGDEVRVCFENEECIINATYDKNIELLSISRQDKSTFWLGAFCLSLIIGIWVYCAGAFLFILLIGLFCILVNIPIKGLNKDE